MDYSTSQLLSNPNNINTFNTSQNMLFIVSKNEHHISLQQIAVLLTSKSKIHPFISYLRASPSLTLADINKCPFN